MDLKEYETLALRMNVSLTQVLLDKNDYLDLRECYARWLDIKKYFAPAQTTTLEKELVQYTKNFEMSEEMVNTMDDMRVEVLEEERTFQLNTFDVKKTIAVLNKRIK